MTYHGQSRVVFCLHRKVSEVSYHLQACQVSKSCLNCFVYLLLKIKINIYQSYGTLSKICSYPWLAVAMFGST